ncbi:MAG: LolA family protein [Planctomycetota bacterium]|jgi:hypothetical protein
MRRFARIFLFSITGLLLAEITNGVESAAAQETGKAPAAAETKHQDDPALPGRRKEILKAWAKTKSVELGMDIEVTTRLFGDTPEYSEGGGTIEIVNDAGQRRVRAESRLNPVETGGESYRYRPSMWQLIIEDGSAIYTARESGQSRSAYKHDIGTAYFPEMAPDRVFDNLKEEMSFHLRPDAEVAGRSVFVVEAISHTGTPAYTFHFDKATGVVLKFVMDDPVNHKIKNVMTAVHVKVNGKIAAKRFQFELPEGFEFRDQTTGRPQPGEKDAGKNP